jgi:uncharacterized protein
MVIVWDESKRLSNFDKHGVDFADIDEAFFLTAKLGEAKLGRFFAAGWLGTLPLIVFFALLGSEGLSIVSARKPYRHERNLLP